MNLEDVINSLMESGPDKYFRHYTTISGITQILKDKYIKSGNVYASHYGMEKDQISVIRSSGDIGNIQNIVGDKNTNICCFIEISFHIVNDKIKNLKSKPINEPVLEFQNQIESILKKYNLINKKNEIIQNIENFKDKFSIIDYKRLHNKIYNYKTNLTQKEGEERIYIDKLDINPKWSKIYLLDNIVDVYKKSSGKWKLYFESTVLDNEEYFYKDSNYNAICNII